MQLICAFVQPCDEAQSMKGYVFVCLEAGRFKVLTNIENSNRVVSDPFPKIFYGCTQQKINHIEAASTISEAHISFRQKEKKRTQSFSFALIDNCRKKKKGFKTKSLISLQ